MYEDARGALSKLQQTTTIAASEAQFKELYTKVNGLSEQFLLSFYISGLKLKIKREILFAQPLSLLQVMALAKLHEDKLNDLKQFLKSARQKFAFDYTPIKAQSFTPLILPTPPLNTTL